MNGYYSATPDPDRFYQGDILSGYDIVILPEKIADSLIPGTDSSSTGNAYILVKKLRTNILIISQTCDIAHREFLAVCPIFSIERVINSNQRNAIRRNQVNYRFWLPEFPGVLEEGYADFQIINTIKFNNLDLGTRLVSLSERYRTHLTNGLNRYFCRPITIEH